MAKKKPAAAPKPAAKGKPAAKAKPAAEAKPVAKAKPAAEAKPVAKAKPKTPAKAPPARKPAAPPAPAAKSAGKAKPIPEGHHTATPHLVVRNSAQAIEFYRHAFGAVELMRMPGPDGFSIGHAEIKIGDSFVYLCDESPAMGIKAPATIGGSPVSIHLYVEDADAVFKKATEAGAQAVMPMMDMFWGDRFGKLVDPFGHQWTVATHKEDLTMEEMGRRAQAAYAEYAKMPKPPG